MGVSSLLRLPTGLDLDLRFDKHKAGIQSNRFVFDYGLRLLPALYEVYNPMSFPPACEMEVELGIGLPGGNLPGVEGVTHRWDGRLQASVQEDRIATVPARFLPRRISANKIYRTRAAA